MLSRTLGVGGLRQQLPPLGFEPREELGFVADGWHRLFRHKVLKLSNHHGDLVDALETCLWPYKTQEAAPPESVSMPTLEEVILETERVLRLLKEASPQTARGLLESWRWLSADDPTNFLTWAVFRVLAGMVAPDGAFATWRELFPPSLPQGGHAYTSVIEDQHKQALRGRPHVDRTVSCKFFWSLRLLLEDLTDQQIRGVSAVYYCFDETQYYMPPDVKPTASDAEPPPTGWEPTGSGE